MIKYFGGCFAFFCHIFLLNLFVFTFLFLYKVEETYVAIKMQQRYVLAL